MDRAQASNRITETKINYGTLSMYYETRKVLIDIITRFPKDKEIVKRVVSRAGDFLIYAADEFIVDTELQAVACTAIQSAAYKILESQMACKNINKSEILEYLESSKKSLENAISRADKNIQKSEEISQIIDNFILEPQQKEDEHEEEQQ